MVCLEQPAPGVGPGWVFTVSLRKVGYRDDPERHSSLALSCRPKSVPNGDLMSGLAG